MDAEGVAFRSPGRSPGEIGKQTKFWNPNGVLFGPAVGASIPSRAQALPQSLAQIYLHIVFSTKNRIPYLRDEALREEMFAYLVGTCQGLESPSLRTGGWEDHIHILCRFGRKLSVADFIKELKTASSSWIKERSPRLADFHWQAGYGAFSISPSHVDVLIEYIQKQAEHHRVETFQEEFRRICAQIWRCHR